MLTRMRFFRILMRGMQGTLLTARSTFRQVARLRGA